MNIIKTNLKGVCIIEPKAFQDDRGGFVKVFHKDTFIQEGMEFDFKESYYSTSRKDVIRGMHFQTPPADHAKVVYVTKGCILDVVLDIREDSPTYGQHITAELSADNHKIMYIPVGCAHGFLSLEDDSSVTYMQTSIHTPANDAGIHINSFGMDWGVRNPILSARDEAFPALAEFKTPFRYN